MRINGNLWTTALACSCLAPFGTVQSFSTISVPQRPITQNAFSSPFVRSRQFATQDSSSSSSATESGSINNANNNTRHSADQSTTGAAVVRNDTSSYGGELPVHSWRELRDVVNQATVDQSLVEEMSSDEDSDDNGNNTTSSSSSFVEMPRDPSGAGEQEARPALSTSVIPPLPETLDASGLLSLDPAVVDIVQVPRSEVNVTEEAPNLEAMLRGLPFVDMFRGSANYIANHRGTLAVYHIPGGLLDLPDPSIIRDLMNDISLTWLLGMRIVIVAGCRHQIEKRIPHKERVTHFGIPVTDAETLRVVKEEAGYVRFELERQLARSLRMQGGASYASAGKKTGHIDGNVVSGNFYSAQPFGILDGIDYKYTGFVRKVEAEKNRQLHANRDICLLTTLGVSPSGESFNVNSESLAATVAGALGASKVIYFTESEMELRHKIHGNKIQNLRFSDARKLLELHQVQIHKRGFVTVGKNEAEPTPQTDMLTKIGWSMTALEQGVKRAHIISPKFGAVLQELYTRDGSGALISGDLYEGIRRANVNDVSNIYDLIFPLIKMGTLVDRPKAVLEKDCDSYYVYTRDNHIVACGQLKIFDGATGKGRYAELGCLVVNKEYRAAGRGDAMLGYLERLCFLNGATTVFVLSTQTMEWFVERGFEPVTVAELPPSRQATYNHARASKIYMKEITSSRDLDQSELWWNR